jgi:hypothetical protein
MARLVSLLKEGCHDTGNKVSLRTSCGVHNPVVNGQFLSEVLEYQIGGDKNKVVVVARGGSRERGMWGLLFIGDRASVYKGAQSWRWTGHSQGICMSLG